VTSKYSVTLSAAMNERAKTLSSWISTAVGRCFGFVLMAKPKRRSCASGMKIIVAKVMRSRLSWISSFANTATKRLKEARRPRVRSSAVIRSCPSSGS
jgi:hypothetical protein